MEVWDGYYQDETLAGQDIIRGEKIPEGLYHIVCDILVKHKDGDYLLMQRDYDKETYPGLYEASAGGSVLKGETPLEGAKRELLEETGIQAKEHTQLYRTINRKNDAIHYGYLCITDIPKDQIKLQEKETIQYRWLSKEEFLKFIKTEQFVPVRRERLEQYLEEI